MRIPARGPLIGLALGLAGLLTTPESSPGGGPFGRPAAVYRPTRVYVPTQRRSDLAPSPMLGSFYPTPYMTVGGNGFSGYTPLNWYGEGTLSMYGPVSSLRAISAPVTTYSRGYDGIVRPTQGNTFSYPFLPPASPVVYPTRALQRDAFRHQSTPPWWNSGFNWVDYR
jgi:hypothetical protein